MRGICYSYFHDKKYGFMRFVKDISGGLWITDSRKDESPYETAFFHGTSLPESVDKVNLPNREQIFEFELKQSDKDNGWVASNIKCVYHY